MKASKTSEKSATRKETLSRAAAKKVAAKKGTGKKVTAKKQSSPGFFSRATHMVGEVLMGTATGAVAVR